MLKKILATAAPIALLAMAAAPAHAADYAKGAVYAPAYASWADVTAAVGIAGFEGQLSSNLWPIGLALIAIVIFPPIWLGWSVGVIYGRIRSRQSLPLRLVVAAMAGLALWVGIRLFF